MSIIEKALEKSRGGTVNASSTNNPSSIESVDVVKPFENSSTQQRKSFTRNHISIDWEMMLDKGMLTPEMARSQMAEEYRLIKRPLLLNAFPNGHNGIDYGNLILVTSSVPGEGKTFTAVNLALSIAMEREKWVLLVDADVAKPSISKLVGIKPQAGLIDLLIGSSIHMSDLLVKTDIPNFSILPAGTLHQYSTELLASDTMTKLAHELSVRYPDRIVIFDSPPLLAATQAPVLSNLVGQVILVIESEVTPQHLVQEAVAKLESCKVVGCVLNKTKKGFGFTYYGLGYGYGYGYYGQSKKSI